jgi:chromosomal replication initiation ATPase DnaA
VSKATGIALDRLYSLTFERKGVHGRGMVAYLARTLAGQRVKDIAEHFRRSPMRISQAIIEFETRLREDESLRKIVDKLKKGLSKQAKKKYFITIA